jgi:hypothetical protein
VVDELARSPVAPDEPDGAVRVEREFIRKGGARQGGVRGRRERDGGRRRPIACDDRGQPEPAEKDDEYADEVALSSATCAAAGLLDERLGIDAWAIVEAGAAWWGRDAYRWLLALMKLL